LHGLAAQFEHDRLRSAVEAPAVIVRGLSAI
jgi:hypothetical protein